MCHTIYVRKQVVREPTAAEFDAAEKVRIARAREQEAARAAAQEADQKAKRDARYAARKDRGKKKK